MTSDEQKDNILVYGAPAGTIELKPHPEDVIDVPADVLAVMNARLKGQSFANTYGDEDRVSKELLVQQERQKLGRVFGSEADITDAFSSLKAIKDIRAELSFENVNRELLAVYTHKLSSQEAVDEVDGYRTILFSKPIRTKKQRIIDNAGALAKTTAEIQMTLELLVQGYVGTHFDVFSISKEMLRLHEPLRSLLRNGRLLLLMDELLRVFYSEGR